MPNNVGIECSEGVAKVTLERPPVNALTLPVMQELRQALVSCNELGVKGIVLTGRPGLFSAGLDVPALLGESPAAIEAFWLEFFSFLRELASSPVPVVAAITGHAPAGGAVIALHCDYRVAARGDFRLGLNEASIGLPVPPTIFAALEWAVGGRQAELLVSTGAMISPGHALEIGFVDLLAEPDDVLAASQERLEALLELPPVAMNQTRLTAKSRMLAELGEPAAAARLAAEAWFSDEAQTCLGELVARLGK